MVKTELIEETRTVVIDKARKDFIKDEYERITNLLSLFSQDYIYNYPKVGFDYHLDTWAYAWYDSCREEVVFNSKFDYSEKSTIIHELTHFICKRAKIDTKEKGCHHLEFAIIYGVLYNFFVKDNSGCFFRAYDIQDDPAYDKLAVNPKRWDDMIKSFKWEHITEVIEFAKMKAEKYRSLCN